MLGRLKDGAIGMGLKALMNEKFKEFGETLDCSVDSGKSKFILKMRLKGELENMTVSIEKYSLEKEGEDSYIVLESFSASKEWMEAILKKYLTNKRYKLPSAVAGLL
jgi:hypothetical protein